MGVGVGVGVVTGVLETIGMRIRPSLAAPIANPGISVAIRVPGARCCVAIATDIGTIGRPAASPGVKAKAPRRSPSFFCGGSGVEEEDDDDEV